MHPPHPGRRAERRSFTPNQVVAYNLARARLLRGWTQDQAAEAVAPYLGARLSAASFSAAERSVEGERVREFNADELVALARGFGVPIGWFLTPPPQHEEIALATPDAGPSGTDPMVLLDALLGTEETLPAWEQVLAAYTSFAPHRVLIDAEGAMLRLGREPPELEERLSHHVTLRAKLAARQAFGELGEAIGTLRRVADVLEEIEGVDQSSSSGSGRHAETSAPPSQGRKRS